MKIKKQTNKFLLLLVTYVTISASANAQKVLVAIASKDVKCRSGNAAYDATNDIAFKYVQGTFDDNSQVDNLTIQLENTYGDDGVKIRMRQSYSEIVLIVRYRKNTSPYDCAVWEYIVSGGDSYAEALDSFKISYGSNNSYEVVANIRNI
jgi:hypothetical protein